MRSSLARLLVGGLGAALLSCERRDEAADFRAELEAAASRARRFLVERQSPDGAWRSATYGALKDGLSLTPPVVKALVYAPGAGADRTTVERSLDWIARAVRADGTIDAGPSGLAYPVYTSSLAVIALTRAGGEGRAAARDAWLAVLVRHQLAEDLGWTPADSAYGGFGYALEPLARAARSPDTLWDADLSSTLFALGALRAAGVTAGDPRVRRALGFVERCQNWPAEGEASDPAFDDGGFVFTPTNDIQNKAGIAGTDARGRKRWRSYGSMTADGIRALLACGLPRDHPRVLAGLRWIAEHFDPATNPGRFDPMREVEREASYYYGCWSLAHALAELGVVAIDTPGGRIDWRPALARELLSRQDGDGGWRNRSTMMKEDDPLIATSFALAGLELCRLAGGR